MVTETQILEQSFQPETQELSGIWTTLDLGFLTGKPEIATKIQILRQVFRTEIQILIMIFSPVPHTQLFHNLPLISQDG